MFQSNVTRLEGSFVESDWTKVVDPDINAAIDNIQLGNRNYIRNSKTITKGASGSQANFIALQLVEPLQSDTQYTLSVGSTVINSGDDPVTFRVTVYSNGAATTQYFNIPISATKQIISFKSISGLGKDATLLFYTGHPGNSANRSLTWSEVKLEKSNKASDWTKAVEDLQDLADAAQIAANNAAVAADAANSLIADIANDNKLTSSEKQELKREWDEIRSEVNPIINQASLYNLSSVTYYSYYTALSNYLIPLLSSTLTSDIVGTTFRQFFLNYYIARQSLLDNITTATKALTDTKNRVYYTTTTPIVPSGGHKVGDTWHNLTLVSIDGVVTGDPKKDLYKQEFRWDGNAWVLVNWNATSSKWIQTDSQFTSLINKTGIDSLGVGETLLSKINQTPSLIELAVNKIQIGGVNLLSNYEHIKSQAAQGQTIEYINDSGFEDIMKITNPSLAANIALKNIIYPHTSTGEYVVSILAKGSGSLDLYTNGGYFNSTESLSPTEYKRIEIKATTVAALHLNTRRCTLAYVAKMQVETGNKGTTLSAAQGDIPDMVGSKLSITDNRIYLGSKNIVLDGNTIAKAISANSLNVGNGNFQVGTNGIIKAKGASIEGKIESNANGNRIVINPETRRFQMINSREEEVCTLAFSQDFALFRFTTNEYMATVYPYGIHLQSMDANNGRSAWIQHNSISLSDTKSSSSFSASIDSFRQLDVRMQGLPTNDNVGVGRVWREGNSLKIKD